MQAPFSAHIPCKYPGILEHSKNTGSGRLSGFDDLRPTPKLVYGKPPFVATTRLSTSPYGHHSTDALADLDNDVSNSLPRRLDRQAFSFPEEDLTG